MPDLLRNDSGMVPGRKIKGFLWMVICVTGYTAIITLMGTPEEIAKTGLWAIAGGGLFLIGGQSLVDAWAVRGDRPGRTVKRTEETVVTE